MSNDYSAIFGYTREELEHYFAEDIQEVAKANHLTIDSCYGSIKEWYNGYKFFEKWEMGLQSFLNPKTI